MTGSGLFAQRSFSLSNRSISGSVLPMRNVHIDDYDGLAREVVAIGNDYANGFTLAEHAHRQAQLLYGVSGLMQVTTQSGSWTVPTQHAIWIPPQMLHRVTFLQVSTRSLYIEPDTAGQMGLGNQCKVISVSPLLRQLLIEAIALDPLYHSARDRLLVGLLLAELSAMSARDFDIPFPRDSRLRQLCQSFLDSPSIQSLSQHWADALFMSQSTFRRYFLQQIGMSFTAWRQRACVVFALSQLAEGKSVTEVALSLGYDNHSAFSTMFRRVTGKPPSFYHPQ